MLISRVLNQDPGFLQSSFRQFRWLLATQTLNTRIGRSKHAIPLPLTGLLNEYLHPDKRDILKLWQSQAGEAIIARQAAVREPLAKARYTNPLNLKVYSTNALFKRPSENAPLDNVCGESLVQLFLGCTLQQTLASM